MTMAPTTPAIAASLLLGLLAASIGAQAQPPECACSPQEITVTLNLDQFCGTNPSENVDEVNGLQGIQSTRVVCSGDIETAQTMTFEELREGAWVAISGFTITESTQIITYSPSPPTSFFFVSEGLRIGLAGIDVTGQLVLGNVIEIYYTNECGVPITYSDAAIGEVVLVSRFWSILQQHSQYHVFILTISIHFQ